LALRINRPTSPDTPEHENRAVPLANTHGSTVKSAWSALPTLWVVGTLAYGLLLIGRSWAVSHRWARVQPSTTAELLELLEECKAEMGVKARIRLTVSSTLRNPALLGWFRPCILLPEALAADLSRSQLRAIFLHELAHIRSNDVLINWLFSAAAAAHWFNPLAHFALGSWRQFQEEAADEAAIARSNDPSGQTYGEVLLHALAIRQGTTIPFGALCLGEPINNLKRRFHMIHRFAHRTPHSFLFSTVAAALVAIILLRPISAQEATNPTQGDRAQLLAEQQLPRHLVPFSPDHFDKYTGYYQLGPSGIFKISLNGDKFFLQLTGQGPVEVYPESETKFFATVVAAQISFVTDAKGNVSELVLHQGGLEQHANRIDETTAKNFAAALTARIQANQPGPGTEESVRKWVSAMEAGQPNYDDMTPTLAAFAREQWPKTSQTIKAFGAFKAVQFVRVTPDGMDVYQVQFENKKIAVFTGQLTPDGKVAVRVWRPMP